MDMIPKAKTYSQDDATYTQKSVRQRIEALFLANIGLVVTRDQIQKASTDPTTGRIPENWHQRLSELRTDHGYTILSWRDWKELAPSEYLMPIAERRAMAGRRVAPTPAVWKEVLKRSKNRCEWREDGQPCNLHNGDIDPIGGGTVKLTPDHVTPHSIDPNSDPTNPLAWQAYCGRHQVMKKNYWDSASGKLNILGILQNVNRQQKEEALGFLLAYFGMEAGPRR